MKRPRRQRSKDPRLSLGRAGEDFVAVELESRGFVIVARNVSIAFVEVDIVARRGRDYALVEVKTAKAPALPETGLCEEQRRRLLHARDHIRSRTREARHVEVLLAAVAVDPSLPSDAGAGPKTELRFFRIGELAEDSRH